MVFFLEVLENLHLCFPRLDLGREKEGVNKFIFFSAKVKDCRLDVVVHKEHNWSFCFFW